MSTHLITETAAGQTAPVVWPNLPPLENGDHLDQPTFHARYEAMPEDARFELVGGIVFMASPIKRQHSSMHSKVSGWLEVYAAATPPLEAASCRSVILNDESEVQPDACLTLPADRGGQSRDVDGYLHGSPELVVEVASSSESLDLNRKKQAYEQSGIREYVVVAVRQAQVHWFVLQGGAYGSLGPGDDGIMRSQVYPGLWLDPAALLKMDFARLMQVLQQGLADETHVQFVKTLGH